MICDMKIVTSIRTDLQDLKIELTIPITRVNNIRLSRGLAVGVSEAAWLEGILRTISVMIIMACSNNTPRISIIVRIIITNKKMYRI